MNYRRIYIENSKVFITMVTSKRQPLLIENIELLRKAFKETKEKIKFEIAAIVILPDHLHMIIKPERKETYPEIVKRIKVYFSKNIDETKIKDYEESESRRRKNEKDIWQRRYWEHSITDEKDLINCINYIHYNPIKHGYARKRNVGLKPNLQSYSSKNI